jgi:hypothetical protein
MFYVPIRQFLRNSNGSESICAEVLYSLMAYTIAFYATILGG